MQSGTSVSDADLKRAREFIAGARFLTVLTGAGVSAESGIPTFRGPDGLWRQYRPEQLATSDAFARDPQLVWEWYLWRRSLIAQAKPNPAHRAIAELERQAERFALITQNVDGLHEAAGSRRVLKVHGDIWISRCIECGLELRDERTVFEGEDPPRCSCGGLLRPGVVWFGESLPENIWSDAGQSAAKCDLLMVVGTSALVYPAAGLIPLAQAHRARVIEINAESTPYSGAVDLTLRGRAAEILPLLAR